MLISEDEDDDVLLDNDLNLPKRSETKATLTSNGAAFSNQQSSETSTKFNRVKNQIEDTIDSMRTNIVKVLDRGQRLDDLNERSEELTTSANSFNTRARYTRKAMWMRTCRARLYLGGTILVILGLLLCKFNHKIKIYFVFKIFFYLYNLVMYK